MENYFDDMPDFGDDDYAEANWCADSAAEKYLREYPDGAEIRHCWKCGRVMKYGSMAYYEGFHFDTCL